MAWLDQIEADLDNMRAALGWGKMEIGEREVALRLAAAVDLSRVVDTSFADAAVARLGPYQ